MWKWRCSSSSSSRSANGVSYSSSSSSGGSQSASPRVLSEGLFLTPSLDVLPLMRRSGAQILTGRPQPYS